MATSYNGWAASQNPDAIGINRSWEPIPGHRFPGGIKSGDVETVMTYLVRQLDARVEPIELYPAGDEWGYHYKQSANSPSLLSCHSSGTAIDYNATRHPNGKRGTWTPAQVGEIRRIQAEVGWVVHWLGDANGTPDEMHFEIKGSPTAVATAAAKIRTPAPQEDDMTPEQAAQLQATHMLATAAARDAAAALVLVQRVFDRVVPKETVVADIKLTRAIAAKVGAE